MLVLVKPVCVCVCVYLSYQAFFAVLEKWRKKLANIPDNFL